MGQLALGASPVGELSRNFRRAVHKANSDMAEQKKASARVAQKVGPAPAVSPPNGLTEITLPLAEFLDWRNFKWSLPFVCFAIYVVDMTTYIVKNGAPFMALALLGLLVGTRRVRWPTAVGIFLLFWLWSAICTVLTPYSGDFEELIDLGKIFLVFLVAVNVLWDRLTFRFFLVVYLACYAAFPIRGTLTSYYIHNNVHLGRPYWANLFSNPNDIAALTILAFALAVSFVHKETPRVLRFASLALCMIFPFTILLTQSRGGFIGMCAFLLLALLSIGRIRMTGIVVVAAIGAAVIAIVPPDAWDRISGLQRAESITEADGSAAERWEIAQTAMKIIEDNPIIGVGRGYALRAMATYNPSLGPKSYHNTYLEVAAETGAPGLLLFLALLLTLIRRARRVRRETMHLNRSADWRRLQLIEFGLYGYLITGIWGTYAYLSLMYVYLAFLYAQTEALLSLTTAHENRPAHKQPSI